MPNIYIKEEDNTIAGLPEEEYNIVYIPGIAQLQTPTLVGKGPTLFSDVNEFVKAITGSSTELIAATNLSALMAKKLLELGLHVLYEEFTNNINPNWVDLADKSLYRIKFLTTGGYPNLSTHASGMLTCAKNRGDCIALLDHAKEIGALSSGETYASKVVSLFSSIKTYDSAKFGAAFSPWCKFDLGLQAASELPGSFAYLCAYANSIQTNPNWYASAGARRGQIPSIVEPIHLYGDAECNTLQARVINADGSFGTDDNIGLAINPICNVRPFGYIVWGNRTTMNNIVGLTASSFLNIRNLCCDIKKNLYNAAREFTFEQNSDILWVNFCSRIRPLLDRAMSGGGVKGYRLIKETTDKKGRLKARIKIVPIEAVEDFELTLEMTDNLEAVTENI